MSPYNLTPTLIHIRENICGASEALAVHFYHVFDFKVMKRKRQMF